MTNSSQASPKIVYLRKKLEAISCLVAPCLECTTCASSCPVFQSNPEHNPRQIIYKIASGDTDGILDKLDFWWCGGCYSCQAHCPQGVPLTEIFFQLKNRAFHYGKSVPQTIIQTGRRLSKGFVLPLNQKISQKRKKLCLPPIKKPAVEDIDLLLSACGFYKLLDKTE